MTNDEVQTILGTFAAAFPGTRVGADMVTTWSEAVGLFEPGPVAAAARSWIETEDRWPTLHQFIEAIEHQCGLRHAARSLPEPLPEPIPTDPGRAARSFAFLREMLVAAQSGEPMSLAEVREQVDLRGIAVDYEMRDRPTYRCFECKDEGFVDMPNQPGRVVPCGRCRVEARAMFDNGHWRPGHSCEICRPARGRRAS